MKELIQTFERELAAVRSARPNTVLAYSNAIKQFAAWLGERSLIEVAREDFIAWREAESKHRSPAGLKLHVAAIRSFYAWLTETHRLAVNPCPNMVVHVTHQDPTNVPTGPQFLKVRLAVQHQVETSALIELLAGSGLRIDAALALRRDQLVFGSQDNGPVICGDWGRPSCVPLADYGPPVKSTDFIRVDPQHCKGRNATMVAVTPCAVRALRRLLDTKPDADPHAPIFTFCYRTAHSRVHNAGKAVGLDISPHSLRHLYGCLMYFRSLDGTERDLIWVRDNMSHSNVSVTDTYLTLARTTITDDGDWNEIVWRWHPPAAAKNEEQGNLFEEVA